MVISHFLITFYLSSWPTCLLWQPDMIYVATVHSQSVQSCSYTSFVFHSSLYLPSVSQSPFGVIWHCPGSQILHVWAVPRPAYTGRSLPPFVVFSTSAFLVKTVQAATALTTAAFRVKSASKPSSWSPPSVSKPSSSPPPSVWISSSLLPPFAQVPLPFALPSGMSKLPLRCGYHPLKSVFATKSDLFEPLSE